MSFDSLDNRVVVRLFDCHLGWMQLHQERSVHLVSTRAGLVVSVLSGEKDLSGLIDAQLGDHAVRGVDGDVDLGGLIGFGSGNLLNFDAVLLSVNGLDLAFLTFGSLGFVTNNDKDGVSLSNGKRAALVLGSKFLGESAGHDLSSDVARSREVGLSTLPPLARHGLNGYGNKYLLV